MKFNASDLSNMTGYGFPHAAGVEHISPGHRPGLTDSLILLQANGLPHSNLDERDPDCLNRITDNLPTSPHFVKYNQT
jgi:hypothetical protein